MISRASKAKEKVGLTDNYARYAKTFLLADEEIVLAAVAWYTLGSNMWRKFRVHSPNMKRVFRSPSLDLRFTSLARRQRSLLQQSSFSLIDDSAISALSLE